MPKQITWLDYNQRVNELFDMIIEELQEKHDDAVRVTRSTAKANDRDVMLTHFGKASAYTDALEVVINKLSHFNDEWYLNSPDGGERRMTHLEDFRKTLEEIHKESNDLERLQVWFLGAIAANSAEILDILEVLADGKERD